LANSLRVRVFKSLRIFVLMKYWGEDVIYDARR